jgi:hypothetical protein
MEIPASIIVGAFEDSSPNELGTSRWAVTAVLVICAGGISAEVS